MRRSITTMTVLVLAVVVAAWAFLFDEGTPGPIQAEAAATRGLREERSFERPDVGHEPARALLDEPVEAPATGTGVRHQGEPDDALDRALEGLVERLEIVERDRPQEYPVEAPRVCEDTHEAIREYPAARRLGALEELIRERPTTPGVRASLLALLGAWGGATTAFELSEPSGPVWRVTSIGACWRLAGGFEGARAAESFSLDLDEYRRLVRRLGAAEFAVPLDVAPTSDARPSLAERARLPAMDGESLRDRDVAILTLGMAADSDPVVQELLQRLLFDPAPESVQARPPVIFVLAHARSDVCRELLRAFLDDPQLGRDGRSLALHWLGRGGIYDGFLNDVATTLGDPDAGEMERTSALSMLNQRFVEGELSGDADAERLLCEYVLREQEPSLKCSALMMLSSMEGGQSRLSTLATALLDDPTAVCRVAAANGLGRVSPGHVAEARAHLLVALPRESDANVIASIRRALAALDA